MAAMAATATAMATHTARDTLAGTGLLRHRLLMAMATATHLARTMTAMATHMAAMAAMAHMALPDMATATHTAAMAATAGATTATTRRAPVVEQVLGCAQGGSS